MKGYFWWVKAAVIFLGAYFALLSLVAITKVILLGL